MIEVILMILAWEKTWKEYALLPIGGTVGYALLPIGGTVGFALVLSAVNAPLTAAIPVDLMAIIALIIMIKQPRPVYTQLLAK
jgi:hypothetical protein